jgi:hypothetical protein
MLLTATQILNNNDMNHTIDEFNSVDRLLNGGLSVDIDFSCSDSLTDIKKVLEIMTELNCMRPRQRITICNTCGKKTVTNNGANCSFCNSPSIFQTQPVSL